MTLKEERFLLLMVSEVSIHHDRQGMAEKLTSLWTGIRVEK
jgi:hypothetical protein